MRASSSGTEAPASTRTASVPGTAGEAGMGGRPGTDDGRLPTLFLLNEERREEGRVEGGDDQGEENSLSDQADHSTGGT